MKRIIEAHELTLKYFEPIVIKQGFSVKVNSVKETKIERRTASGIDILSFGMLHYAPSFIISHALVKNPGKQFGISGLMMSMAVKGTAAIRISHSN